MKAELPFADLTVVALEQAVTGPYCSRQLADLGARVIKIERPDGGDFSRGYDSALRGVSAYFAWLNRGKESVVLDLKTEAGLAALHRLVARADVFVHNLAPGAVERLGLGYDEVSAVAPRLVWVGISGYGPDGPYRDKKAYDMLIQAESGIVSLTGTAEQGVRVGFSVADICAGAQAYASVLAALRVRDRTGRGDRIDVSMLESLIEWVTPQLYVQLGTGVAPARAALRHSMIAPYGAYRCSDGEVMLAVQNDREWTRLCDLVLERPDLSGDPRYATNPDRVALRGEIEPIVDAFFGAITVADAIERLERGGIPNAAVNELANIERHSQLRTRGRWTEVETWLGSVPALVPPHNIAGVTPVLGRVPALGEHTAAVLEEIDMPTDPAGGAR